MNQRVLPAISIILLFIRTVHAANLTFSQSSDTVEAYDFVEITAQVEKPDAQNPFLDVSFTGSFAKGGVTDRRNAEGFCDSADGRIYRIRFMPAGPGDYSYSVVFKQGQVTTTHIGKFTSSPGHRRGPIRVDPK